MKTLLFIVLSSIMATYASAQLKSFHDFSAVDIDGKEVNLGDYKGKKVLVINVASECGNTPQYETLERLYQKYGSEKFVIIGFPANNFGAQEPGSNPEIKEFCTSKYRITFPLMAKISVKGDDMHPVYQWLTHKSENGVMDAEVTWNFQKFMIDENGHLAGVVDPDTEPDCDTIIKWLEQ